MCKNRITINYFLLFVYVVKCYLVVVRFPFHFAVETNLRQTHEKGAIIECHATLIK